MLGSAKCLAVGLRRTSTVGLIITNPTGNLLSTGFQDTLPHSVDQSAASGSVYCYLTHSRKTAHRYLGPSMVLIYPTFKDVRILKRNLRPDENKNLLTSLTTDY